MSSGVGEVETSVSKDDETISIEQLQMIKARTMFQMTEEIPSDVGGGTKRLLFLTNSQADLLASSSVSLQKMLDALEIPRPKLVINMLLSCGRQDSNPAPAHTSPSLAQLRVARSIPVVEGRGQRRITRRASSLARATLEGCKIAAPLRPSTTSSAASTRSTTLW